LDQGAVVRRRDLGIICGNTEPLGGAVDRPTRRAGYSTGDVDWSTGGPEVEQAAWTLNQLE